MHLLIDELGFALQMMRWCYENGGLRIYKATENQFSVNEHEYYIVQVRSEPQVGSILTFLEINIMRHSICARPPGQDLPYLL